MIHVPGKKILRGDLPVGLHSPALRAPHLEAVGGALLGIEIEIELEITQILLERLRIRIHGQEDQPVIAGHARRRQQSLADLLNLRRPRMPPGEMAARGSGRRSDKSNRDTGT